MTLMNSSLRFFVDVSELFIFKLHASTDAILHCFVLVIFISFQKNQSTAHRIFCEENNSNSLTIFKSIKKFG